jgi:proline racemase
VTHTEVRTSDYHTAGEPFRIVTAGVPDIPGSTVLERREAAFASPEIDAVRQMLCHEPRGHADMYGCFVIPPNDDGADFGVLFWHKDGYSTACGHGTIALGTWAVDTGRVSAMSDDDADVVIDVPSGRVTATVRCSGGVVDSVRFGNVPSYVLARGVEVPTSRGSVRADVSYGGAIYASVSAHAVGMTVTEEWYGDFIALGREIKGELSGTEAARHPSDDRLSGIYGVIFYEEIGNLSTGPWQRNVTVFADGEVDRSPCGSGSSARVALLAAEGRLPAGSRLRHDSIVGTTFFASVTGEVEAEGRDAVLTEVEGSAYRTGEHSFVLDPRDPVGTGFVLR